MLPTYALRRRIGPRQPRTYNRHFPPKPPATRPDDGSDSEMFSQRNSDGREADHSESDEEAEMTPESDAGHYSGGPAKQNRGSTRSVDVSRKRNDNRQDTRELEGSERDGGGLFRSRGRRDMREETSVGDIGSRETHRSNWVSLSRRSSSSESIVSYASCEEVDELVTTDPETESLNEISSRNGVTLVTDIRLRDASPPNSPLFTDAFAAMEMDTFIPSSERITLLNKWNAIIRINGAAPLSFANDIDDEQIPSLPKSFEYLERDYD